MGHDFDDTGRCVHCGMDVADLMKGLVLVGILSVAAICAVTWAVSYLIETMR